MQTVNALALKYTRQNMCMYSRASALSQKKDVSVTIPAKELLAYRQGTFIQHAMPSVSVSDREFLVTGMSAEAWDETLKDKEE